MITENEIQIQNEPLKNQNHLNQNEKLNYQRKFEKHLSSKKLIDEGEDYFDFSIKEKLSQYHEILLMIEDCAMIENIGERIKTIYQLRTFAKAILESLERANVLFQSSVKGIAIDEPKDAFNNETQII